MRKQRLSAWAMGLSGCLGPSPCPSPCSCPCPSLRHDLPFLKQECSIHAHGPAVALVSGVGVMLQTGAVPLEP
eukprot:6218502-Pyramimonas_sp.AAC.1